LGLPVISAAISLYINIEATPNYEEKIKINLLDLNEELIIPLDGNQLQYDNNRDYLKSAYNIFLRKNYSFNQGYDCKIYGNIPINAGAASSSALTVAWVKFLSCIIEPQAKFSPQTISEIAYASEVLEFSESGGNMDHITSSIGNLLYIETQPISITRLSAKIEGFVLGDSLEKKKTINDLSRVKNQVLEGIKILKHRIPTFNLKYSKVYKISKYLDNLNLSKMIFANIINRDLTLKAKNILKNADFDKKMLGDLLNKHQYQLNENLGISTKKINSMIDAALDAGALGCKINGSGFGGTMFAYAPGREIDVAEAIKKRGGEPYIIDIVSGVNTVTRKKSEW